MYLCKDFSAKIISPSFFTVYLNDDQNYKLKLYHNQRGGKKKEKRNRFAKKI